MRPPKDRTRIIRELTGPTLLAVCVLAGRALADDWPTHRHDNARSGVSAENLEFPLEPLWTYRALGEPSPAWPGPARADYYTSSQVPLVPRLAFDRAHGLAVAGGVAYVGSSADHAVHAVDVRSGSERWSFTADGPVRTAPSLALGKVYFGCDDGAVYCVGAADGTFVWKDEPAGEDNYLVPSNGTFVSPWAVRSGVVVVGDTVYAAAGFFPAEGVHLCALDARTGRAEGEGRWRRLEVNTVSLQGYMLASSTRLYFPAGRSSPYGFARTTGQYLGQFFSRSTGSRGTFALLDGASLFVGPSSRGEAVIEEWDAVRPSLDRLAVYDHGTAMVVTAARSYLLSDTSLLALDRRTRGVLWRSDVRYPHELILAGDALIAGGDGEVAAFDAASGGEVWSAAIDGRAYELAVADGTLFVSTDHGVVHAFGNPASAAPFLRGDANEDGVVDIGDPLRVLFYLFVDETLLACGDHGDADDSGVVDITDSLTLLNFLFLSGPPPRPPFSAPGLDPTPDDMPCGDPAAGH